MEGQISPREISEIRTAHLVVRKINNTVLEAPIDYPTI